MIQGFPAPHDIEVVIGVSGFEEGLTDRLVTLMPAGSARVVWPRPQQVQTMVAPAD